MKFIFRAMTSVLGNIPGTDIYESIDICQEVRFLIFQNPLSTILNYNL